MAPSICLAAMFQHHPPSRTKLTRTNHFDGLGVPHRRFTRPRKAQNHDFRFVFVDTSNQHSLFNGINVDPIFAGGIPYLSNNK